MAGRARPPGPHAERPKMYPALYTAARGAVAPGRLARAAGTAAHVCVADLHQVAVWLGGLGQELRLLAPSPGNRAAFRRRETGTLDSLSREVPVERATELQAQHRGDLFEFEGAA
jgi:hypothetical protein